MLPASFSNQRDFPQARWICFALLWKLNRNIILTLQCPQQWFECGIWRMHGHCPQKLSLAGSLQLAEKELQKRPPMHATRPDFPLQARRMLEHHWGLQLYLAYQRTGTQLRKEAELRWFRWHVWLSCGQMWIDRGLEVRAKMCRHSKPGQKCYHHVRYLLTQNENELRLLNPSSHIHSL